jgi:hypothetical protein
MTKTCAVCGDSSENSSLPTIRKEPDSWSDDYVSGYVRSNGTYVAPHYRTSPNATVRDNYSYKGNYNPYTGPPGRTTTEAHRQTERSGKTLRSEVVDAGLEQQFHHAVESSARLLL